MSRACAAKQNNYNSNSNVFLFSLTERYARDNYIRNVPYLWHHTEPKVGKGTKTLVFRASLFVSTLNMSIHPFNCVQMTENKEKHKLSAVRINHCLPLVDGSGTGITFRAVFTVFFSSDSWPPHPVPTVLRRMISTGPGAERTTWQPSGQGTPGGWRRTRLPSAPPSWRRRTPLSAWR